MIGPFGTHITKDPTIQSLTNNVFDRMAGLLPKQEIRPKTSVRTFSVEDAIKELLEMEKIKTK